MSGNEPSAVGIESSLELIKSWMNENGAALLVQNLAPGATADQLAHAEEQFGIALPADLRTLWLLHNGQREQRNGFIEWFNLLSVGSAVTQHATVLKLIELDREVPNAWAATGGTPEELHSNHWLPFAALDSDSLVVHGVTGRVFSVEHDDSPWLLAASIAEWLQGYAARVIAGDYAVKSGFCGYCLQLRDRNVERRQSEALERDNERERYRRETPLLDQFRQALSDEQEQICSSVLADAFERGETQLVQELVELMFASNPDPRILAGALRPFLGKVTLKPDQWVDVALGGVLLENHAIRDVAISRSAKASTNRIDELVKMIDDATEPERSQLEGLLTKLRAKLPPGTESSKA